MYVYIICFVGVRETLIFIYIKVSDSKEKHYPRPNQPQQQQQQPTVIATHTLNWGSERAGAIYNS